MTRYYVYDGIGSFYVDNFEEARMCLVDAVGFACEDGEWSDWIEDVYVAEGDEDGKVVVQVKQTNLRYRPENLGEDGYDEDGVFWSDHHSMCDYEVEVL